MTKEKRISVREFLGRVWNIRKFNWVLIGNDGDVLQITMDDHKKFYSFEFDVLDKNETVDITTEFSLDDWDMGVQHWISASALPCERSEDT